MCLNTGKYTKKPPKAKIAKEDITVYKVLLKQGKKYFGLYKTKFQWERGIHYYQSGTHFSFSKGFWNTWMVHEGLHACLTKSRTKVHTQHESKAVVVKMIVPKGARYHLNQFKTEIVASEMIFPHSK
jgi:hypothetical protein